jgi:hypothetical protein
MFMHINFLPNKNVLTESNMCKCNAPSVSVWRYFEQKYTRLGTYSHVAWIGCLFKWEI